MKETSMRNRGLQDHARRESERLVRLDRVAREKAEARVVAEGVAETIALSEARGEAFTPPRPRRPRPERTAPEGRTRLAL
jgi:hypothetical protein